MSEPEYEPMKKSIPWPADQFDEAACALLGVIHLFEAMDADQRTACLGYLNARYPALLAEREKEG